MTRYLFLLCLWACSGSAPDARTLATLTAENAYAILSMAYSYEAAQITRAECQQYTCTTDAECEAVADRCPALVKQKTRWQKTWAAYDLLATAIENGRSEEAPRLYCELKRTAPAAPLPGNCP